MTRVDFRPMGPRSGYAWLIGTAAAVLAVSAYGVVTDPANLVYALAGPLVVVLFAAVVVRSRQWLEVTADGTVLVQRRSLVTRRVRLEDAAEVFVQPNDGGSAVLVARGARGDEARAPLLLASSYAQGYQRAEVLETVLSGLSGNRRAAQTAELLRRQLEHVRAGGPVRTAPLAAYAHDVTGALGAAGAAGAAGILGD